MNVLAYIVTKLKKKVNQVQPFIYLQTSADPEYAKKHEHRPICDKLETFPPKPYWQGDRHMAMNLNLKEDLSAFLTCMFQ